jgi:hypothetical protein
MCGGGAAKRAAVVPAAPVGRMRVGAELVALSLSSIVSGADGCRRAARACPREGAGTRSDRVLLLLATYRLLAPPDQPVG